MNDETTPPTIARPASPPASPWTAAPPRGARGARGRTARAAEAEGARAHLAPAPLPDPPGGGAPELRRHGRLGGGGTPRGRLRAPGGAHRPRPRPSVSAAAVPPRPFRRRSWIRIAYLRGRDRHGGRGGLRPPPGDGTAPPLTPKGGGCRPAVASRRPESPPVVHGGVMAASTDAAPARAGRGRRGRRRRRAAPGLRPGERNSASRTPRGRRAHHPPPRTWIPGR